MEHIIKVAVREKIAVAPPNALYICGNSDFVIDFDFDDEWAEHEGKIARFVWNGQYHDVPFTNNRCAVPVITNTHRFKVGVYAGSLETTTAAFVSASKSILCENGAPAPALPGVYEQLEALFTQGVEVVLEKTNDATTAAENAEASELAAKLSAEASALSESNAKSSEEAAKTSEGNARASELAAAKSAEDATNVVNNAAWVDAEINENGHLILSQSDNFNGATFQINKNGNLEVVYK